MGLHQVFSAQIIPEAVPYTLEPRTITVSGYPALVAHALVALVLTHGNGNGYPLPLPGKRPRPLTIAHKAEECLAYLERHRRVLCGKTPGPTSRCHGCRKWGPRTDLTDRRLGFDAYCTRCVETYAKDCRRRHHRLPRPAEFYCITCRQIRPVAALPPPDADGRRRWRCRACRAAQVAAAERRRRERRR